MTELVRDPVCHMQVPAASFATEYLGINYDFCSEQCRDRFHANPHLYMGFPGRKAPAQEGVEVGKLEIKYDLIQVTEEQIENKLASVGATLGQGWADRLKRAFIHFEEEFEIDNLEVTKNKKGCH